MPKDFDDFIGEKMHNPLENSGLTPDAVKALQETGDPELLQTVANGVMRALSRGLHPDVTGKAAGEFFMRLVESNKLIQGYEPDAVQQLATDFTRRKRGKKPAAPEIVQINKDNSHRLIGMLASASLAELGPTFSPQTGIEFFSYQKQYNNTPTRIIMHRTGEDRWSLSQYHHTDIEERELDEDGKLKRDNPLGHQLLEEIDWRPLVDIRHEQTLKRGFIYLSSERKKLPIDSVHVYGLIHAKEQDMVLYNEAGKRIAAYPNRLAELNQASPEAFYRLSLDITGTSDDERSVKHAAAREYMYMDGETEDKKCRMLGTVDKAYVDGIVSAMKRSVQGDEPRDPRSPQLLAELTMNLSRSNQLSDLGFPLSAELQEGLGEYFTPTIEPERYLVMAADESMYILGSVQRLYSHMYPANS